MPKEWFSLCSEYEEQFPLPFLKLEPSKNPNSSESKSNSLKAEVLESKSSYEALLLLLPLEEAPIKAL